MNNTAYRTCGGNLCEAQLRNTDEVHQRLDGQIESRTDGADGDDDDARKRRRA